MQDAVARIQVDSVSSQRTDPDAVTARSLRVMVLAGGPDREREVSLESGKAVAAALRDAGHDVIERDIHPADLSSLDEFTGWRGQVIFPALHGGWGEGGGLQRVLDDRGIAYVGCRTAAADLCMDKHRTKVHLFEHDLPTLPFELIGARDTPTLSPPVVIKPPREGSSIDLCICEDQRELTDALATLQPKHEQLLVERFAPGMELTVGVLDRLEPAGDLPCHALPPIRIVPATRFYDYKAKYHRNDTKYLLDPAAIGLKAHELEGLGVLAVEVYRELGCRHMARVDFIVDEQSRPWVLEVNTIPGFTSHSLLPMAAAHMGIDMSQLVDRLVQLALRDG